MEQLTGYIEHIIYSNANNGYTVFELKSDTEEITCVGILHAVDEGEKVTLTGSFTVHPSYGEQFSFDSYEVIEATDEEAIRRYLSSGAIKGIRESLANKIVDMFGEDTFRVIEENPELLADIKGISNKKAMEIAAQFMSKQDLRRVMLFLQQYGISNNLATKIYGKYGLNTYPVIRENPYKLAEEIDGVGFKTADEIAQKSGIVKDSEYRIRSGIIYVLNMATLEGHCYLPKDLFIKRAAELLSVDEELIFIQAQNLAIDRKIILVTRGDEVQVYPKRFYYMEQSSAKMLLDIDCILENNTDNVRRLIAKITQEDSLRLDEDQIEAVVGAVTHGVSIITGGPGTGKTTVINTIIKYFEYVGSEFALAAPTGRAAKRMTETTGYEASTIQRLLGLSIGGNEDGYYYDKNEQNPFELDAIIIDEMSMVDLPLLNALLKAVMPGTALIMVGDINQLPSVGAGSVLKDIIMSEAFLTTRLKNIYRQEHNSDIVINAHKINEGILPDFSVKSEEFYMLERRDIKLILKQIVQMVTDKLAHHVGVKPQEIQVLTPMRKGVLGVENLNPVLQNYVNPPSPSKKEKEYGNCIYREGDKVMQIKNNYQVEWEVRGKYGIVAEKGQGVFNGDLGIISTIDTYAECIEVMFDDGHIVNYPYSALDELELAYAVTIHKSQGSEYPAVIIPLLNGPKVLFSRNLLYTAVTRARRCVVLIGSSATVQEMVDNTNEQKRYTALKECIEEIAKVL